MFIKQKISLTTIGAALITLATVDPAGAASFYSITDLGTLPGSSGSIATGINDSGQAVGYLTKDEPFRAFFWENGEMTDLGTTGEAGDADNSSYAFAINDAAQIVGEANNYAVLWEDGMLTELGTLGGRVNSALDINNLGQVVGRSATTDYYSDLHAFVWNPTNGMQDLNSLIPADSGWLLSEARAINEAGQIVGSGTINGRERAFLLTPQPVPEPASGLGILAFGAFGAGALLLRKG